MFKKIIKFFLVLLLAVVLALVIFRNQILKASFKDFVYKKLKVECKIESVNLWFDSLAIKGLKLNNKDFDASAKNILIKFKFQKGAPVYVSEFDLSDVTFKIKSLEGMMQGTSKKKTAPAALPARFQPIQFNLKNVNVDVKSKSFDLVANFSIIAEIGSDKIFLKDADIPNLKISSQDFELTNLTFKKFSKNKYVLKIPRIRIKEKTFTNFFIPVKINVNSLAFPKAKNAFFGPSGYVSAKIDLRKYDNFCFAAKFQEASFEKVVDAFTPEDAAFKGLFNGSLRGCMNAFQVETLEGVFQNKGNGFINIKKESSLAFLKPYLDKPSYDALIDNFKNYEYNIGVVSAKSEKDALNLNLEFTSDAMGKRNVNIIMHDILRNDKGQNSNDKIILNGK